ncbi:ABC transporter substrate-binding protein [Frankia sp. AiPs1]|uniref:ABC transporter substrate-binding protein n=1 Tax=Frankia sp. AiPs1 TaxID=573493 RepID=UPI002044856D|nr:ABC transporter substrate-binding protein [Frankia sp. AiPs1]MCM3920587.1 ABC transporter substrate-binding protein [Frankia sp. AiPs1]
MRSRTRWRQRGVLALGMSAALMVSAAACGSSGGSSSGSTGSTDSAAAQSLGPAKPATGDELKIGFITDGSGTTLDNSTEVAAAQAATSYLNDYQGGVAGHRLALTVCDTKQTPAGATDCANQLTAAKVPVVLMNNSGNVTPVFKVLSAAKVPLVLDINGDESTLGAKSGAYILVSPLTAALAGPAQVAKDAGAKKAAIFVLDVPGATGPVNSLDKIFYAKANVGLTIQPIPPGTADTTPQVQTVLGGKPEQVNLVGDPTFCTGVLKSLKTLGYTGSIVLQSQCVSPGAAAGIPGGYDGMKVVSGQTTNVADPEYKLYLAAMKKYQSDTDPTAKSLTAGGWVVTLGFSRAMAGLTAPITSAGVEKALATMPKTKLPLGGTATFQCDGKQVSITPSVCSTGGLVQTLDSKGKPTSEQPLDVSSVLP